MARQNWKTASWLNDRPIMYKSAMHCMKLPVANLEIDTTIFTWTGMAKRMFVSRLCKSGAIVLHKYSKVETFIHMCPLNSLALNEPNTFWSRNPGWCNPRSWAHRRRCCLPLHSLNPCSASVIQPSCCECYRKIASSSLDIHSKVVNKESWKMNKIVSLWTSGSIFTTTLLSEVSGSWEWVDEAAEWRKRLLLQVQPLWSLLEAQNPYRPRLGTFTIAAGRLLCQCRTCGGQADCQMAWLQSTTLKP